MAKYRLEFVKRAGWGGVTKYANCATTFGPYLTRTGKYHIGTYTEEELKKVAKKSGIDLAALQPPTDSDVDPKKGAFWKTFAVKVTAAGVDLDTDEVFDEITWRFLKGHPRVADGKDKIRHGHEFVLVDADAEAKRKNKKYNLTAEAYSIMFKLTPSEKRRALRVLGQKYKDMSDERISASLGDFINRSDQDCLKFIEMMRNPDIEILDIIQKGIDFNVLRKSRTTYYYETSVIGQGIDETVAWFKDGHNAEIVSEIDGRIKLLVDVEKEPS